MSIYEEQLRRDTSAVVDAIDRGLHGGLGPVADQAVRVRDLASELALVADRTSERVRALGTSGKRAVDELAVTAEILQGLAGELHLMTQQSVHDLAHLQAHLTRSVRANAIANRRRSKRFEVDIPVEAQFAGRTKPGRVIDLSLGGARIDLAINTSVGTPVTLRIADLTHQLTGEVVRATEDGTQLRFTIGDVAAEELRRFLARFDPSKNVAKG